MFVLEVNSVTYASVSDISTNFIYIVLYVLVAHHRWGLIEAIASSDYKLNNYFLN